MDIWIVILYVLELVPAYNFDYEMVNLFPGNRNPQKEVEIGFYKEHTFSSLHRRRLITVRHKDKPIDFKLKFSLPILCLLVTKHAICQPSCG